MNRHYTELDIFDTYTYLSIGFCSMLASLILFLIHAISKDLRKQPGDLVMMIAFSEFFLSLHWFMSALRTDYVLGGYPEESLFCKINSGIAVTAATLEITYNLSFIAHILFSIRNSIRRTYMPDKSYHVFCWSVTTLYVLMNQNKMYKRNPFGTCSVEMKPKDVFMGSLVIVVAIIFAGYVYSQTKIQLPMIGADMIRLRRDITNYFSRYLKALISIWIVIFLSFIAQLMDKGGDAGRSFFAIGRFGNTVKVIMPMVFFFIRTEDPVIKKFIDKYIINLYGNLKASLRSVKNNYSRMNSGNSAEGVTEDLTAIIGSSSFLTTDNDDQLETELICEDHDQSWMTLLPTKLKELFTRTLLASISVYYPNVLDNLKDHFDQIEPNDAKGIVKYKVVGKDIMEVFKTSNAMLDCDLTIYAPAIFGSILSSNLRKIDFSQSFNIYENEESIRQAGESGGGASGELFLFTFDSKLIVKTITQEEHLVFLNMLYDYGTHFSKNSDSLVAKIYGLFDFNFMGAEKSLKLIVMENLFTIGNDCILRKYDMKGSTHSRRVLKTYESLTTDSKISKILKDLDFHEIDKQLVLEENGQNEKFNLAARIHSDVKFFRENYIIDYSLILAVVDTRLCDQTSLREEMESNKHHIMKSSDSSCIYVLGIIDYFQLYDFKKKFERSYKRVQKCDPGLETSSQPPNRYARRFERFIESISK